MMQTAGMRTMFRFNPSRAQGGFSMLEVLMTLLIVLFGLLGLAGLQVQVQKAQFEAYQRAQALILLQDMVDRLNTSREVAPCFAITGDSGSPYFGTGSGTPSCTGFGSISSQAAAVDAMSGWNSALQGAAEQSRGSSIGAMVGARGCITFDTPTLTYTVAVAWEGMFDSGTPAIPAGASAGTTGAIQCGTGLGLYSSETKRRVVWTTVRLATLL